MTAQPRTGRIAGVRSFVEAMIRSRSTLAAPPSTIGPQLARLDRLSVDSAGHRHGRRSPNAMPMHDDTGASMATHRADEQLTVHAAYSLVWSKLSEEQRLLLELQNAPIPCEGAGRAASNAGYCYRCKTTVLVMRREGASVCARDRETPVIPDQALCRTCGQPAVRGVDGRAHPHARGFTLIKEMRTCDVREGDGASLWGESESEGYALYKLRLTSMRSDEELAAALFERGFGYPDAAEVDRLATARKPIPQFGPYTKSQIRTRIRKANAVIEAHPLFRVMSTAQEEEG